MKTSKTRKWKSRSGTSPQNEDSAKEQFQGLQMYVQDLAAALTSLLEAGSH